MKRPWIVAPLLLLLIACARGSGATLSPDGAATSEYWFDSLPEMVATSDAIVLGTVTSVKTGITEGTPPDDIQLSRADVAVKEVFYGPAEVPATMTVETLQFVAPKPDWRLSGNTVLAFVKLSTEPDTPGIFYPINEQSVYLVSGTDVEATTDHDSFSQQVSAMTIVEIRDRIERAKEAIADGRVSAQIPVGG